MGALDPATREIMELMAAGFPKLGTEVTDAAQARRMMAEGIAGLPPGRPLPRVEDRRVPGAPGGPEIGVRVYWPRVDGPPLPVVVFFHGGGFVLCDLETHDGICRSLAAGADALVVSVDYRLAPEHRFPAAVDDCYAVTEWVHRHAAELHGDPARLAVAGDSAGGNLAAVTCLLARDRGGPPIAFQLLVYPATDFLSDRASHTVNGDGYFLTRDHMAWFHGQYVDDADCADFRASPLRAASLAGLPPALVITAEYDPLRDDGEAYAARLADSGVSAQAHRVDGMFHGFFSLPDFLPAADQAHRLAAESLRKALT